MHRIYLLIYLCNILSISKVNENNIGWVKTEKLKNSDYIFCTVRMKLVSSAQNNSNHI